MEYLLAGCPFESLCPVFGALLLMALGIWLEKKIPVARKLSNYAPACFLIFVLHYPLIMLIPSHIWKQSFFAPFVLIPAIIFLIVAFYLFLRKILPGLPALRRQRPHHPCSQKKIKACILFLLLTVPAALGAVWCAKHAYRYHLAVHPLPYSPEQGALLEKHRQDKRNARLNPHAPVLFLGSSTMDSG